MLEALIFEKPVIVEGNFRPYNDPRALIKIETLIMNWIIRTGEIISSEIISACSFTLTPLTLAKNISTKIIKINVGIAMKRDCM